ncbi:MAG: hypothetical protein HYZ50_02195 [Deltaproteobacteria bacterium]|nr:hypothetical protein [Deltaproteobacteria bacterium]
MLWALGYSEQALQRSREALALARELADPQSMAFTLYNACTVHHFRREWQTAREHGEMLIALGQEQAFAFHVASGFVVRGLALIEQGQEEEGIAQTRQGLAALQGTGATLPWTVWSAPLAEAYWKLGYIEEGMALLKDAFTLTSKNGGHLYEAELYRLKGELTLQRAGSRLQAIGLREKTEEEGVRLQALGLREKAEEAERCFHKAIKVAQKQQAKSLELRATVSLARLWQQQGKQAEARQRLAEIYGWFTEGFDTKDLQEAKVLLEELSR